MGFIMDFAKEFSGQNNRSSSSYSGSYSSNSSKEMHMYQCRYCGKREKVSNPSHLSHGGTGCKARAGRDNFNGRLDHVWERLD